ncbi:Formyl transferase, C-terminal-like [Pseudocohnilembus persalinus]|uniref:DNA-3-methyladenine glycosylase II n=1 Tax=Pseudocohnilembus persalinus TaxID=266149 RepID=A0A0V0QRM8_PSEPJ|nr:Formyl transferase, C-terminal-like [Pseudocohnilembus persalinus]|eukprot:KRX04990.1 Formyl transferase, C-terminal-like [Pseudocohnilembus persalinus]
MEQIKKTVKKTLVQKAASSKKIVEKQIEENDKTDLNTKPWLQFPEPESTVDLSHLKATDLLPKEFYHQDVVTLSKELLGKVIVRETDKGIVKCRIVETEAYKAPLDKACHAYGNKKTERTSSFWLEGGHCYMYSIYGANYCLNVVASQEGNPEAVLIRACEPLEGQQTVIPHYRGQIKSKNVKEITGGPAKFTKAMDIDVKRFNGIDLRNKKAKLYIEKGKDVKFQMGVSRRVNINYAKEWVDAPWRFYIKGNTFVSVKDP